MTEKVLEVSFYGMCHVRVSGVDGVVIKSAKQRALIALLVMAYEGRRTRNFLQETLWPNSKHDGGSQNLRKALSVLKRTLGDFYNELLVLSNSDIQIDLSRVRHLNDHTYGEFLEGFSIREKNFDLWLERQRSNPGQSGSEEINLQRLDPDAYKLFVSVVPFKVVYGEKNHGILGDVIAEDISRALSRSHFLSVISPLSTRQFTRQELSIANLREKLNSDYTVLGSIRANQGEIALDVDFINTANGHLLWTRRFEWREQPGVIVAPEIIAELCQAIGRSVINETIDSVSTLPLERIEDHRLLIGGIALMHKHVFSGFIRGRTMIEEVMDRNPKHSLLYSWLAKWYVLRVLNGWSANRKEDTDRARNLSSEALDLDPESTFALTIDGLIYNNLLRDGGTAKRRYELALSVNSNESLSWLLNGTLLSFTGEAQSGVKQVERAHRLSPLDPFGYFYDSLRASSHLANHDYQTALQLAERSYTNNPRHSSTLRVRVAALLALDRGDEARVFAREMMANEPRFTITEYLRTHPAGEFEVGRMMANALLAVGVPE